MSVFKCEKCGHEVVSVQTDEPKCTVCKHGRKLRLVVTGIDYKKLESQINLSGK